MSAEAARNSGAIRVALFNAAGEVGGGERFMLDLADGLDSSRYRVCHICPTEGAFARLLRTRGWPVDVVDLSRLVSLRTVTAVADLLRRHAVDILHSAGARANIYGRLAAGLAGVPVVMSTVHTSIYNYEIGELRRRLYLWADKLTLPLADCVLATSQAMYDELLTRYKVSTDRLAMVRNGVDLATMHLGAGREVVRASFGVTAGQPLVGCIGRMTEQKGQIDLLRSLPDLVKEFPSLRCVIVGDGPLRGKLAAEADRLGVMRSCVFTGVRTDVTDLLEAMDIVVVPSISEGIPYIVLEAMGAGRPIVATRVGGIPEVIQEGRSGILIRPREPVQLTAVIGRLLRDPDAAKQLGAGARVRAERFSRAGMVKEIDALYTALLRARGLAA